MQLSIAHLCQLIPGSECLRYNREGVPFPEPPHRKQYSLLPIITNPERAEPGSTYWALPGKSEGNAHGAEHVVAAARRGARFFVLEKEHLPLLKELPPSERVGLEAIIAPNVEEAFYSVASLWRRQAMMPMVAITGSVGKSTTAAMLKTIFTNDGVSIFATDGAQTTVRDVARSILHISTDQVAGVFEVGVSRPGEMAKCMQLLQPSLGIVTAVDADHLHDIGSIEAVAEEKLQLFSQFTPSQIGMVCGDYPLLAKRCYAHPVVRYGLKGRKNVITAKEVRTVVCNDHSLATRCRLKVYDQEADITLPGNHIGVVYAALAASAVCYFMHTPFEVVVEGLQKFKPIAGRFQVLDLPKARGLLVNDSHNANPASVRAAVSAFHDMHQYDRKITVLGEMADLGDRGVYWHRQIGRDLFKARSITHLILVGEQAHEVARTAPVTMKVTCVQTPAEARAIVEPLIQEEAALVLVKGSEQMGLGSVVDELLSVS
ncbi:MAG: Mur ligase family protein [Candidatus Dependentiae bacterium]|jgi:UDP-N-acetylmuramoyl-tripeptide--D-alanyl-D-alanine ligase